MKQYLTVFICRRSRNAGRKRRCEDYVVPDFDFFLFSSTEIDVKGEHASDDRKLRQACKASIVPSICCSSSTLGCAKERRRRRRKRKERRKDEEKERGGPKRGRELMIGLQMFSQMAIRCRFPFLWINPSHRIASHLI